MNLIKILDTIEATMRAGKFDTSKTRLTYIRHKAGEVLHPFSGEVFKHEAYIEIKKTSHYQRLDELWVKVRNYAYFNCPYDYNEYNK